MLIGLYHCEPLIPDPVLPTTIYRLPNCLSLIAFELQRPVTD